MSNFVIQFKSEVSRVARKEVRTHTQALKKATLSYRSEIAELKRQLSSLASIVKGLSKSVSSKKALSSEEQSPSESFRFRAQGFAKLRQKLDLTALQMAQIIGVSAQSVYHWETGKSRPRASQLLLIAKVRKMGKREVFAQLNKK
jgi:DNA-binding transcriptional regulator YiaG